MEIKKYNKNKIFVTGVSGSGKTTFSKKYSELYNHLYFDFEKNWGGYKSDIQLQYDNIIKKYPNKFITDAIPYTPLNGELRILNYFKEHENNIKIVIVCCTDKKEYDFRLNEKFFESNNKAYKEYHDFYFGMISNYINLNTDYYDSFTNEYITYNELINKIKWIKNKI